jgi:2-oxoglutarate ferredoxin oxidoreductase subunit beta
MKIETNYPNTWCPGCGNFAILEAMKKAIQEIGQEKVVLVADIGCNSKIVDYLNVSSLGSLHGRPIPSASGIKMANPKLKVVVFTGDGGSLNEGISHLIHAAKKNTDITVIMHNNRLFALTTGQYTASSPKGFKGKSTPDGSIEEPLNTLELMMAAKASFIGRTYSSKIDYTKKMIIEAINHKGFSFIEVLQPCPSFFNTFQFYNEKVYEADANEKLIKEWNYDEKGRIPLGIFYKEERPTYEDEV